MENDHEQQLFQLQEEDNICNSAAAIQQRANTVTLDNCNKRHCSSAFQEPSSKKAAHRPPSSPSPTTDHRLLGFTKLPLPHSFPTSTPSPLRRTVSEPIYSEVSKFSNFPVPVLKQSPQENSNGNHVVQDHSSPLPNLHHTMSDPNSFLCRQIPPAGGTPPRPPSRNVSPSLSFGESPSSKRLRRMKERLKEMSLWWTQVVHEGDEEEEEEDSESDRYNTDHNTPKEESENHHEIENPSQESVWVEKNGDCLVLHFKCPCGHGYQILLSRNNCYYKLTTF